MKRMKFFMSGVMTLVFLSSCSTIFTGTKQSITFMGTPGVGIYKNNNKITEITQDGISTVKIKKSLSSTGLVAKQEGYRNTPLVLDAVFNPISVINLFNPIGWLVDLGTGAACKYDDTIVTIVMEKERSQD